MRLVLLVSNRSVSSHVHPRLLHLVVRIHTNLDSMIFPSERPTHQTSIENETTVHALYLFGKDFHRR